MSNMSARHYLTQVSTFFHVQIQNSIIFSKHFHPVSTPSNTICSAWGLFYKRIVTFNYLSQTLATRLIYRFFPRNLVWCRRIIFLHKAISSAKSNQLLSFRNHVPSMKISATLTKNSGATIREFTFHHQSVLYSLVQDVRLATILLVQLKVDLNHFFFHYYKSPKHYNHSRWADQSISLANSGQK